MTTSLQRTLYTAHASVTGGREGHGSTDDGALDVQLRAPKETGGQGGGTNPEQLFAVGYAACFQSALGGVARRAKVDVSAGRIDSSVALGPVEGGGYGIAVTLDVTLPGLDQAAAEELVEAAHQVCPYSNATRGNIDVTLTVHTPAV
jgi:osmotically inducible protein OsmC